MSPLSLGLPAHAQGTRRAARLPPRPGGRCRGPERADRRGTGDRLRHGVRRRRLRAGRLEGAARLERGVLRAGRRAHASGPRGSAASASARDHARVDAALPDEAAPRRPARRLGIDAISLDLLEDDVGHRLVVDGRDVAWNGLEAAFDVLERQWQEFAAPTRPPIKVTVIGAGVIGKDAVEAATKYGDLDRAVRLALLPGVEVTTIGRNLTGREAYMKERFGVTDVLVDATQRHDPSRPLVPNAWLAYLPEHAVVCDLVVDPYLLHEVPPTVRGIEGIPQGNLDRWAFAPDDPAWAAVPDEVDASHRRWVVSCYSWPGVHPHACMELYGRPAGAPAPRALAGRAPTGSLRPASSTNGHCGAPACGHGWGDTPRSSETPGSATTAHTSSSAPSAATVHRPAATGHAASTDPRIASSPCVVVTRVMVEQHQPVDLGPPRERGHVAHARMSPPHVVHVLVVRVLTVVHEQVGPVSERESRDPLGAHRQEVGPESGLVIGDVCQRAPALLEAVPDRRPRVQDGFGDQLYRSDRPWLAWSVVERHPCRHLRQVHGEQRRREVGGDSLVQRGDGGGRPPDVQFRLGHPDRGEHAEPLHVVDVQVGEQDVDSRDRGSHQGLAQGPRPGAGVEHDHAVLVAAHLHARGVAAVTDRLRTRRGDRAPASPDAGAH